MTRIQRREDFKASSRRENAADTGRLGQSKGPGRPVARGEHGHEETTVAERPCDRKLAIFLLKEACELVGCHAGYGDPALLLSGESDRGCTDQRHQSNTAQQGETGHDTSLRLASARTPEKTLAAHDALFVSRAGEETPVKGHGCAAWRPTGALANVVRAAGRATAATAVLALLAGCSPSRLVESARLGLEAGEGAGGHQSIGPQEVTLAGQQGDLYRPATAHAALLMVPGVTPQGRDDPRLIAFASTLARHGFLVFVPELPGLRALHVGVDDADAIARSANALATCFPAGVQPRFAAAGISYAVAPVVLAALKEPTRRRVGLIVGIGGYYDIVASITYLTTGYFRPTPEASWHRGTPEADARWFFVLAGATHMPQRDDRELLIEIAKARLAGSDAELVGPVGRLGADGRAMLTLAENTDPDRVPQLLAALPAPVRADIERLDLKRYPLATLNADLLLIHGRDDPLVPATESRALAAAVAPGRAQVVVVTNLSHVEIRPGGIMDSFRLWSAAYRLLTLREVLSVPAPDRCEVARPAAQDLAPVPRRAMAREQRVSFRPTRRRARRLRGASPRP